MLAVSNLHKTFNTGTVNEVCALRGVSLDLHPRVFGPGRCGQTGLAGANVILEQTDDRPSFEIAVLNSFADHLWRWLERAGQDCRIAVAAG